MTSEVLPVKLNDYTRAAMTEYGASVIEDRALPDFRDGMKPVQRRALYAAFQLGLFSDRKPKKSARLVGDIIGKYHPHGDSAAYGAVVTMVNSNMPPFVGQGNWGTREDTPAAMRYTEIRLSKFGEECFFNRDYLATIRMVPNYDGTLKEPLVLPSLLPNILMNGSEGIGVAYTALIPSFGAAGLIKVLKAAIADKGKVSSKVCYKNLKFHYSTGGEALLDTKEARAEFRQLLTTGRGYVDFYPEYNFDAKSRTITFYGIPPRVKISSVMEKVSAMPQVEYMEEATDKTSKVEQYEVKLRRTVRLDELDDAVMEVADKFMVRYNYKTNVTIRKYNPELEETRAKFKSTPITVLLEKWLKWRVALEKRAIKIIIQGINQQIWRLSTMLLAVDNRAVVLKSLEYDDSAAYLMKKLKITQEQADFILNLKVRALKALNGKDLRRELKKRRAELKQEKWYFAHPAKKVLISLDSLEKDLEVYAQDRIKE